MCQQVRDNIHSFDLISWEIFQNKPSITAKEVQRSLFPVFHGSPFALIVYRGFVSKLTVFYGRFSFFLNF